MLTVFIAVSILGVIFMVVFFLALCADDKACARGMIVSLTRENATGGHFDGGFVSSLEDSHKLKTAAYPGVAPALFSLHRTFGDAGGTLCSVEKPRPRQNRD